MRVLVAGEGLSRRDFLRRSLYGASAACLGYAFGSAGVFRRSAAALEAAPRLVYPTTFFPVIVETGGAIAACVAGHEGFALEGAELVPRTASGGKVGLDHAEAGAEGGVARFVLTPVSAPAPGTYDLAIRLSGDGGAVETGRARAVKVTEGFPEEFRFVVIADYHVGDPRGKRTAPDMDFTELRARVLREVNSYRPEFILAAGDIVYSPGTYARDYADFINELTGGLEAPTFAAPGNHDLMMFTVGEVFSVDGHEFWMKDFGPLYYSFDFGRHHFVAMNTYDWVDESRNVSSLKDEKSMRRMADGAMRREQFEWIKADLEKAAAAGKISCVFGHHTPAGDMAGSDERTGDTGVVSTDEFVRMLAGGGVRSYFYGHRHRVEYDRVEGMDFVCTSTSGSELADRHGWGFSVVDVKGGKFESEYIEVEKHPLYGDARGVLREAAVVCG
ncbi:MAG: metallophosphoesterase [bacterium]